MPGAAPSDHENATYGSRFRISPRWWKTVLVLAVVIVLLGAAVRGFIVQRFTIPSESMQPTLQVGDEITVWRPDALRGDINRGDIVVFDGRGSFVDAALPTPLQKFGSWVGLGSRDVYYVKRVIGVGGDTVKCCDPEGRLLLNGEPLDEDYTSLPASATEFSVQVPAGTMWVMGDNRNDSADSRSLLGRPGGGFIPIDRVVGPVIGHGSSVD
ncbi:signal peptidase I [Brevibacterium sp.]|uniref:signal peptidase I n=1 Tax=Brevibacterium sp. TaxID=1701 RepID=UPI0028116DB7|nr:signal peptidase I [Brevibacterium sp.]